jgi:hypothetical protein
MNLRFLIADAIYDLCRGLVAPSFVLTVLHAGEIRGVNDYGPTAHGLAPQTARAGSENRIL